MLLTSEIIKGVLKIKISILNKNKCLSHFEKFRIMVNRKAAMKFVYIIFGFLGRFLHPFFYSLMLLDIVNKFPTLKDILKAVGRPIKNILFTLIFLMIMLFLMAILSYSFFKQDFRDLTCSSLLVCFITIVDQTFKNDGGVSCRKERSWGKTS